VVIIFLVFLLINDYSCENYSGLDIQGNTIPCYEAIKYQNLEKSREYNTNDVYYDQANNEEGYDFSNEKITLSNSVIPMPSM
jgi:hypothetical protein